MLEILTAIGINVVGTIIGGVATYGIIKHFF